MVIMAFVAKLISGLHKKITKDLLATKAVVNELTRDTAKVAVENPKSTLALSASDDVAISAYCYS